MLQYGLAEGKAKAAVERQQVETELRLLRARLEPHFEYNVFIATYKYVYLVSEQAGRYIKKMSRVLHYTLYETASGFVPLKKELLIVKNYLRLERVRHGPRLNYKSSR